VKVRTEARRERIIEVAAEVFLAEGFERASMSEITRRVGGSKATLYGYFASKEELFLAVVQAEGTRQLAAAEAQITAAAPGQLPEVLTSFCEAVVTFLCSDATCAAHRMVLGAAGQSDIGQTFYESGPKRGLELIAHAIHAAMRRGELRQADPWIAAQQFNGLLSAEIQPRLFHRHLPPLEPGQAHAIAERAVDLFMRGYQPDGSAPVKG
jgi:AcrR family transcriptional regulator